MKDNIKAFLIGTIIIAVVSSLSLWLMDISEIWYIGWLSWASPAIGSFITAIKAKSNKIMLALLLAVPSAVIFGIENYLWQLLGKGSDFPGLKGFYIVVEFSLILAIIMCIIGGLLGNLATRNKTDPEQQKLKQ